MIPVYRPTLVGSHNSPTLGVPSSTIQNCACVIAALVEGIFVTYMLPISLKSIIILFTSETTIGRG